MSPLVRRLGVTAIAAVLLIAGGVKLWTTAAGPAAAGAMLGAGLITLGIAVRDWSTPQRTPDEPPT